jgi:hypothetical protein
MRAHADRSAWEARVVRQPFSEEEQDADARFWDRIPVDERAGVAWDLSKELHLLVAQSRGESVTEADLERRLPRASWRVERR